MSSPGGVSQACIHLVLDGLQHCDCDLLQSGKAGKVGRGRTGQSGGLDIRGWAHTAFARECINPLFSWAVSRMDLVVVVMCYTRDTGFRLSTLTIHSRL